jgi:hypothetical protein
MTPMAANGETKSRADEAREHLARSRALREETVRSAEGVVRHLRRAAELRRRAARANGRAA